MNQNFSILLILIFLLFLTVWKLFFIENVYLAIKHHHLTPGCPYGKPACELNQYANEVPSGDNTTINENPVIILMWTKYYSESDESLMSLILSGRKWDSSCCTQPNVNITLDRAMLQEASVIVFYNYPQNLNKKNLPSRYPGQIWVLFAKESPVLSASLKGFDNMFNWTMTYRRDSNIWTPYGYTIALPNPIPTTQAIIMPGNISLDQWIDQKSKSVAGVISHCPTQSRRERIVAALRNYSIPIEIFGNCGNRSLCRRSNKSCDHEQFWRDLGATYKFYFAAENSLCEDYITEKFWRALIIGVVPLAYGGANYTAVAPPDSFIDVSKFQSAEDIAVYLNELVENKTEYEKYFEWRRGYQVVLTDAWQGWCSLCQKSLDYQKDPTWYPEKAYGSISDWWVTVMNGSQNQRACSPPVLV